MGIFSEWQPQYAERGVVTFPVRNKVPAVKGYLKLGERVSEKLAEKFAGDNTFGFACKRNKITVLDIDTSDEKVLADALDRHGPTPIVIRSGSGNFQAWYRHNGERRRVRPDRALPIDILGDGFVIAPPSLGAKGRYHMIDGSLDDINRLPTMRSVAAVDKSLVVTKTGTGNRNDGLWRYCMRAARGCHRIEDLMSKAMDHNSSAFYQPLPAEEVLKIVASAWGYEVEGKNWFGHGDRVIVDHRIVDDLAAAEPRAFALLSLLMRNHWGREFYLTKAYAENIGWAINTLRDAREVLLKHRLIECLHAGGRGPNDPPVYRFRKGSIFDPNKKQNTLPISPSLSQSGD